MSEPQRITYPAEHWTDRGDQKIVAIVVHGTGGGIKSSLSTLKHGDGRGVSIHVLIDKDGTQYVMVPDEKGANHAGAASSQFTLNGRHYQGGMVNKATLGVELVNMQDGRDPYPPAQLQSLGWLVNHWRAVHGPLPILRHADLDPTRRRDPYQLSTQEIERAAAQASPPPVSLPTTKYKVLGVPVWQQQSCTGPVALYLNPGTIIQVDKHYPEGTAHLASGAGFIRVDQSVEAQP